MFYNIFLSGSLLAESVFTIPLLIFSLINNYLLTKPASTDKAPIDLPAIQELQLSQKHLVWQLC